MFHVKHPEATMRLPDDWEGRSSGGYFQHLVKLAHLPCGFETSRYYDPWGLDPNCGEAATRRLVYGHKCNPDD